MGQFLQGGKNGRLMSFFLKVEPPCDQKRNQTLPKALRTHALTALTSNFGLVGLVQYAW